MTFRLRSAEASQAPALGHPTTDNRQPHAVIVAEFAANADPFMLQSMSPSLPSHKFACARLP